MMTGGTPIYGHPPMKENIEPNGELSMAMLDYQRVHLKQVLGDKYLGI